MYNIQPLSPEIHNAHMHGHGARGGVRGTGVSLVLPRYRLSMSSSTPAPAPCVAPKSYQLPLWGLVLLLAFGMRVRAVLAVSPGSCRFRSAWGGIQGWSNPREISRHSPLRDLLRTRRRRRVYLLVVVSSSREHSLILTP